MSLCAVTGMPAHWLTRGTIELKQSTAQEKVLARAVQPP